MGADPIACAVSYASASSPMLIRAFTVRKEPKTHGTGRLIEYPYSTPIGSLNMILSASEKAIKQDPERIKMIVKMHEQATDYAMAHPEEMIQVAMQKLGQQRKSIEIAVPNVELTWKIDDEFIKRAKAYSELMVEKKQVRQAPDMARAITEQFM